MITHSYIMLIVFKLKLLWKLGNLTSKEIQERFGTATFIRTVS
jgi:hypothetical protein